MQSTHALRALPVALLVVAPLASQARYRVTADKEWFYQAADGRRLAQIARGAEVQGGAIQGDWITVTLDGWIFATSVGPSPKPEFDLAVTPDGGENLRAAAGGALVGHLAKGFGLKQLATQARWVHVQRQGWMKRASLLPLAAVSTTVTAGDSDSSKTPPVTAVHGAAVSPSDSTAVDPSKAQPNRRTTLYRAPDGPPAGAITSETPLRILSRSGEWARVQFEGWVKTSDLQTNTPGVLVGVSAAELRTDPARFQGQVLKWKLQFIAVEIADDLRPDVPDGATYLLARGPSPEHGFVYVVVPDAKKVLVASLAPLANIEITARVRVGRSRYLGNPVVDLMSLEVRP
ncbi:MAG TPA: hypothetical protein VEO93_09430 [Gemmatimonadales bacterium]|nr:hypothetical protein [Gemmatimonadales bacterium]